MSQELAQGYRLSPQQRRLWQLHQSDRQSPYVRCLIEITGELNESLLRSALNSLVARYEILRTSFQMLPGMTIPVQVIADESPVKLNQSDLTAASVEQQRSYIDRAMTNAPPAEFSRLPLLTTELIRTTSALLLIGAPGLCLDSMSLRILFRELANTYQGLSKGETSDSSEVMQYADIAEWQNELVESPEALKVRQQWSTRFLNDPLTDAPNVRLSFQSSSEAGDGIATINLNSDFSNRLDEVATSFGVSVPILLQACWHTVLLLGRASGEVAVSAGFDGRNVPELVGAIGPLERQIPISSTTADSKFSELLRVLSEQQESAARLQQYFSHELLKQADAESQGLAQHGRDARATATPALPYQFSWREQPDVISSGAVSFSYIDETGYSEPFAVNLIGERLANGGVTVKLVFDQSLISATDALRLSERLETLIGNLKASDDGRLSDLNIIGNRERQSLLVDFNNTRKEFPIGICVHEMFAEHSRNTPDATALVCEDQRLTYGELNERANRIAHQLIKLGVVPDVNVGLCLERSADLIIGLLAIMKAGGAYVPLDPGLPFERLKVMLEDVGARVLISRKEVGTELEASVAGLKLLPIDCLSETEKSDDPAINVSPENLAYIIFTSGSTGKPKGVGVEHRQLANYVHAINDRLRLTADSSYASVSTIAADLGNTVVFPALTTGATLHLISEERASSPDSFADYCHHHQIDCLKIVPSHLRALLSAAKPAHVLPRKRLVLGGEACPASLISTITEMDVDCETLNHYGPTEATVGATTHDLRQHSLYGSEIVPLGRPLSNVQVLILDQQLQLAPIDVSGELHIGGAGVARGYVGRADVTAEKFIPHPFPTIDGERLYRTGDLARYRSDGTIEFLGRIDDQVKIHGYRIEPEEIAAVLREHPAVKEAVVIARPDPTTLDKRLVAYVVARAGAAVEVTELKTLMQSRLPEYMLPKGIVFLESLPLTRNGKIDRKSLPEPEFERASSAGAVAPRNDVEETLAKIWCGVLGIDKLSIHDNFFELGGDSILSIQIVARANQAGLKLTPRNVFQHQTIAELAEAAGKVETVTFEQGLVTGPVPLTPVQKRFLSQAQPEPHHYNQAMLFDLNETIDAAVLEQALERLISHHDALRLRFDRTDGEWSQSITGLDSGAIESTKVAKFALADLPQHAAAMQASLNLETGPLMRIALFESAAEETSKLLIVIHHLAVDGVSWRILVEDLQTLYNRLSYGKGPKLPPKTTSFKNWSERLQEYSRSDELQDESGFWLKQTGGAALPIDHDTGENNSASAAGVSVALNPRETLALLMEAPSAYRTQINEVLVTALVHTLAEWTGSPSVLLDLEGHGREEILPEVDLTRTVGWFTTIFPVALDLTASENLIDRLLLVKEQLRTIPNRGIGYGVLRYLSENAEISEALSQQTQAQIRFNYLGQTDRGVENGALLKPAAESSGPSQSPASPRGYYLNVIAAVNGGQLRIEWTYSRNIHLRETIEKLAARYLETLRTMIVKARSADTSTFSPSDFSSAKLSREDLNKVLAKLRG